MSERKRERKTGRETERCNPLLGASRCGSFGGHPLVQTRQTERKREREREREREKDRQRQKGRGRRGERVWGGLDKGQGERERE